MARYFVRCGDCLSVAAVDTDFPRELPPYVKGECSCGGRTARLALIELEQSHAHYYPECAGGCPAHEAIGALRVALAGVTR